MKQIKTFDEMQSLFDKLSSCDAWSLHLLKIRFSKTKGAIYNAKQIVLKPSGKLTDIIEGIGNNYASGDYCFKNTYERIDEYEGINVSNVISYISVNDSILASDYISLKEAISNSDSELTEKQIKYNGYVICGIIDDEPIKLFSLRNPITSYNNKHRFFLEESSYKEIRGDVLQIKEYIDAFIYDGYVYMMDIDAEKLFNLERTYKLKCDSDLKEIANFDIVSDFDLFSNIAMSGHNPRSFMKFNKNSLGLLSEKKYVIE